MNTVYDDQDLYSLGGRIRRIVEAHRDRKILRKEKARRKANRKGELISGAKIAAATGLAGALVSQKLASNKTKKVLQATGVDPMSQEGRDILKRNKKNAAIKGALIGGGIGAAGKLSKEAINNFRLNRAISTLDKKTKWNY